MLPGFRSSRSCSVKPDSPANFRTASSDSTGPRRCLVRASLKPATLMAKSDLACSRREIVARALGERGASPVAPGGVIVGGLPAPPPARNISSNSARSRFNASREAEAPNACAAPSISPGRAGVPPFSVSWSAPAKSSSIAWLPALTPASSSRMRCFTTSSMSWISRVEMSAFCAMDLRSCNSPR